LQLRRLEQLQRRSTGELQFEANGVWRTPDIDRLTVMAERGLVGDQSWNSRPGPKLLNVRVNDSNRLGRDVQLSLPVCCCHPKAAITHPDPKQGLVVQCLQDVL
jgi:hypothetical protein